MKFHWRYWAIATVFIFLSVFIFKKKFDANHANNEALKLANFQPALGLPQADLNHPFRGNPLLNTQKDSPIFSLGQRSPPSSSSSSLDLFLGLDQTQLHTQVSDLPLKRRIPIDEKLTYNILWNGLTVGEATLTSRIDPKQPQWITLSAQVRSNGLVEAIYPVNNYFETLLTPRTGTPVRYYKNQNERGRQREDLIEIDVVAKQARYRKYKQGELRRDRTFPVPNQFADPLGVFYIIRSVECDIGQKFNLSFLGNKRVTNVSLARHEDSQIQVPCGTFSCLTYIPDLKDQEVFDESPPGEAKIYFERNTRVPIKIDISLPTPIGRIAITLRAWTKGTVKS